ncbi:hypothetical protein JQX09_15315 [Sulfitobacter pseudonitzschiae]|uniref:SatD family (SatD) n=1 Tax=Pseudosulfitobacter pseudonitzschiae TaxID=1402135 RepID=A0A9Q2NPP9_9RHOB|nr:SatD family protein [Pseudosulfitobacter pseudonitzschiae]MBM2293398.1 hypothetical protein [Pseudosulfitobacter pseudonitzschiae]MBM2298212.1 hypothetical protein [Pseudosulfitobacter pseudonitzschiae]MBM2303126.1 hypothetical protein [Pseudosulfitobacter pseudonitzschiae]MBM2312909.1 hypothetical protein [Pseudosulfitobacter pseudonitzschiae]MBM2317822.1 hypothetical protein [Pseudosulfitobacter pseudonitzschiae]
MTDTNGQRCAVVMGDLVRSESSLPVELLHAGFNQAVDRQNLEHAASLISPLTITLGDEFQGLTHTLTQAIEIVRGLRLALLAEEIDCRFVVGTVEIKSPINSSKAWNMMGPGLARARNKLNQKKTNQLYRFSIAEAPVTEALLDAIGVGLSTIERSWTDQQREDISALLGGLSPAELSEHRNVSVHSIYKVRRSGDFDAYTLQWSAVNKALSEFEKKGKLS